METPAQEAARLLIALDELVGREGGLLRGGYYDLAAEIRERTAPLVQQLAGLAGQPGVEDCRPRLAALQARSAEHAAFISGKITALAAELRLIDQARHRVAQVAPVYTREPARGTPRWQAAV